MHSGVKVYPSDIKNTPLNLGDIAHHLAGPKNQRFGGSLEFDQTYSVAQHSILMATYANSMYTKGVARACLLHDATEAYLGDVVSPLKAELNDYKKLEADLCSAIYSKYNIATDEETTKLVKEIDMRILLDEVSALMPHQLKMFADIYAPLLPLGITVDGKLPAQEVKDAFLYWADYLNIRD